MAFQLGDDKQVFMRGRVAQEEHGAYSDLNHSISNCFEIWIGWTGPDPAPIRVEDMTMAVVHAKTLMEE